MGAEILTIAVIIPTRGRDACLRDTLRDLARQTHSHFELWVIDQNDVALSNLNAGLPASITFHHEKTGPIGSHAGRNHGIFRTTADLCVFVDDDVQIPPDFLEKHRSLMSSRDNSETAMIAGRVIQPKDNLSETEMRERGRLASYSSVLGRVSGNFFGSRRGEAKHIHECNFSALTSALKEVGGFNEEFLGNAYFEGTDLSLRIIEAGYAIAYEPSVALTHLQDGGGGNRVADKAEHTYWYLRNYCLLNSIHMFKPAAPLFIITSVAYLLAKALRNRRVSIFFAGIAGLIDGLKYFSPASRRLRLRSSSDRITG